jgi:predicted nucleic acid-binding protein
VTLYLDTSDLVKLYLDEDGSAGIRSLVAQADAIVTSAVTYAEVRATFARRRRERLLNAAQYAAAVVQFDRDWSRLASIPLMAELAQSAGRLADRLGLRGFDAIQLASFELLASRSEDELHFSSADERLVKAAKKLG